jgi:hypothetical protein
MGAKWQFGELSRGKNLPLLGNKIESPNCSLVKTSTVLSDMWIWQRCTKFEIIYWPLKEERRNTEKSSAGRGGLHSEVRKLDVSLCLLGT